MSFVRRAREAIANLSTPLDRLPIRVRLAAVSTALTFVILCTFAAVVGQLTVNRIRSDFYRSVAAQADELASTLRIVYDPKTRRAIPNTPLSNYRSEEHAVVRVLVPNTLGLTPFMQSGQGPTDLGPALDRNDTPTELTLHGYRVVNRLAPQDSVMVSGQGPADGVVFEYARPLSDIEGTVARVHLLLVLGVLAGTGLALLAGLMIARRAMAPIARLTSTAGEIARTRDPRRSVPQSAAEDEVAELARTFDDMLRSLSAARGETEAMLAQQRQFVADASHELRTPLTSVLANLELLADTLEGDQGDAARSALRSSRRMRRLVADLLLLARSDVGRVVPRTATDLAQVVVEAAAELGPLSEDHTILLEPRAAVVDGVHDDLLRMAINLIENAVRHTPPGSTVTARTGPTPDGGVELVVEDDGPGVPRDVAPRLFERFVRGAGDRGGSFGLGLSIVRAVAEAHGGSVSLRDSSGGHGACFVVRLPGLQQPPSDAPDERAAQLAG
jgi:two-component system, OmpR family, sensor kinase